jgi:hypothetical protein
VVEHDFFDPHDVVADDFIAQLVQPVVVRPIESRRPPFDLADPGGRLFSKKCFSDQVDIVLAGSAVMEATQTPRMSPTHFDRSTNGPFSIILLHNQPRSERNGPPILPRH